MRPVKSAPRQRRKTRKESQQDTRRRLLEADADVFAERGFHGASVDVIAERAGFSKGALYSNFANKDELFLALYDERYNAQVVEVTDLMRRSGSSADVFRSLRRRAKTSEPQLSWLTLTTEFWLYAVRNPKVRGKFAKRMRNLRDAYRLAIEQQFAIAGVAPPVSPSELALILQVLDDGLSAQHFLDPRHVPKDAYFDALKTLFDAFLALSTP